MAFNQNAFDFVVANLDNPFAIAAAMAELGISSSQLADAIGVDTAAVNSFLSDAGAAVADETGAGFVDTSPVDTGPVSSKPAYTQEQYQDAGQFIAQNIDKPEVIAQVAQDLGLSTQDILTAVQTVNQDITKADVENYLTKATSTVDTGPVDTGPVDTSAVDVSTPSSTPKTILTSTTITDAENNTYDRKTILKLAQQVSQNFDASKSSGGAYGVTVNPNTTIGFRASDVEQILGKAPTSAQMVIFDIARGLASQGITDVSELAKYKPTEITEVVSGGEGSDTTQVVTKYIDPDTNKEISLNLGSTYAGEGGTQYVINIDPSGTAKFVTVAEDTSDAGTILPIISLALMAFPGVGTAIGSVLGASGATATALGNAIINAGISVAAGVPVETAIKNAAVTFGVSQAVPNLTGNAYVDNAVRAVATSALTGGDVQTALTTSLISTGAIQNLGNASITGNKVIDSGIVSSLTSAAQAAVNGGDIGQSAIQGFVSGAAAATNQQATTTIPPTSTTITGGAGADTTPASGGVDTVAGGLGSTVDVGMDTTPSVTQDDVLGIVRQEQTVNQAQSTDQAMQGAQQITTAEAQARELYPLTERYLGPNGTVYLRDINTGKITQVLPQGDISQVTGGGVYLDTPKVIGAIESLPANAVYQGILYAGDPKLIGKQLTADDLSSLSMSSGRDANVLPVGNLVVTKNADGTVTQLDKVTGDTATIDANGNIVSQTKSAYTKANEVASGLTGTAQAGLGELGAALSATAQQLGVDSQAAINKFKAIQSSGELMRPEYVNQQSQAFVDEIYRVASNPNSTTEQIARAIASSAINNPAGAAALLGTELIQELPALLLPGGKVAQFLGSMALNAAESAGAQALQKIDELKVTNPNATPQELARMARQDAGVAGAVTAAIGLIPGANNVVARTLLEPVTEALEEGLIEYLTSGDVNAAKGKAVLGAVIGGKTAAAINTGEKLATAVQNNFGVQVPGGVAAPAGASLTVTGTRLPTDTTVNPQVDLTPDNLGTLPTTGVDIPTFDVALDTTNTAVVVAVDANNNQASVIDNTGALTIVPANGLTPGQTTVLPTAPTVTMPTVPAVTTTPAVTTGVVLQDNGNGTSLVLTQDGGATNVPSVDVSKGGTLLPGSSVTVNTSNNTATATGAATGTATGTATGATTGTQTTTGAGTATDTGAVTDTATGVNTQTGTQTGVDTTTQTQSETVKQVTSKPLLQINTEEPKPTQPEDLISKPVTELTPEDQLLQQIIQELEKPTVPETPPPPPIEPLPFTPPDSIVETPPVSVDRPLTISPRTVRPTVPPGSRVEESAQILPIRPGLSEGYLGDIEGTPEEKQQPVWNVRSLKLRRLLGI